MIFSKIIIVAVLAIAMGLASPIQVERFTTEQVLEQRSEGHPQVLDKRAFPRPPPTSCPIGCQCPDAFTVTCLPQFPGP
ncbi:hypothetical protein DFH28DRAFT_957779 [Melampsora americana]|nr:hypothetical protein DFH28DRAFT_957779 [Melampsora americana]